MKFYHYTPDYNFREIEKSGLIKAKSNPFCRDDFAHDVVKKYVSERVNNLIDFDNCIFGLLDLKNWNKSKLINKLFDSDDEIILIESDFENLDNVLVRDLDYLTSTWMNKNYGKNLWKENLMPSQFAFRKPFRNYIESSISLKEYSGNYKIPEILIPFDIEYNPKI